MDSRLFSDLYFSANKYTIFGDDFLKFPRIALNYQFSSGRIRGNVLIDISFGIAHLLFLPASKSSQEMIALKPSENSIMELNRWLHDRTGEYDWIHASAAASKLEGERDKLEDHGMSLKSSITQILKCDFELENITSPVVLPLADCVLSAWILNAISKNEDEFIKKLEKMMKLLKSGGHLLLFSILDATYMMAGAERINLLKFDENFVKGTLSKVGLVLDYYAVQMRRNKSELTNYKAVMFTVAHKE